MKLHLSFVMLVHAACTGLDDPTTKDSTAAVDDSGPGTDDSGAPVDDTGTNTDDSGTNTDDTGETKTTMPDNPIYVRDGASGDGSDWANALDDLPDTLERGATYVIAAGSYDGYDFDTPNASEEPITLWKATDGRHGTDVGWDPSYADGQATFGPIKFTTDHHTVDGTEENGFRFVGDYQGLVADVDGAWITLRNTDLDGNFGTDGSGYHNQGACNVTNINGAHIVFDKVDIHNAADDGVGVYGDDITIRDSKVHNLHGCGTDGGCGPCYNGHSDGLELEDTSDVLLDGNLLYDIESTAAMITGRWDPSHQITNLTVINNIFYTPATGITVYLSYIDGLKVYNNIIWGRMQGSRYGGLAIGPELVDFEMKNNIILNINFDHLGGTFDPDNHDIDHNMYAAVNAGEYTMNDNEVVADPLFAAITDSDDIGEHIQEGLEAADFMLTASSPAIDYGIDLSGVVDEDMHDQVRPQDGDGDGDAGWDLGPQEYIP